VSTFAFTFARGGSKGLPGKNIRLLAGKPLLHYAVEAGLGTPGIDRVFVSTDDAGIAEVARRGGAEVIERPADLATDTAPEWRSWRHAIDWVEKRYGAFGTFVSLPATTPLREPGDVAGVLRALADTPEAEVAVAVARAADNPYFNMVVRAENGLVRRMIEPDPPLARRQDAPQAWVVAGSVYATTPGFIRTHDAYFEGRVASFEVPRERAVDIDDLVDFRLAEALLQQRGSR
jgi:CMP-N-acetylneuraminic acid synthetase